jgi:DNA-binding beta-propeller fold protein YncE
VHSPATPTGSNPQAVAIDPFGRFAYVTNWADDTITEYTIDQTPIWTPTGGWNFNSTGGVLTRFGNVPTAANPRGIVVDPTGRFVYVGMTSDTQGLGGYSIDQATGALTPLPGFPMAVGDHPERLAMDRTGGFLYTANATGEDVTSIKIDPVTGAATVLQSLHVGASMVSAPSAIAVHPSGNTIYITSAAEDDVLTFDVNAAGGMADETNWAALPLTGAGPDGVAVQPAGSWLVVADADEVRSYDALFGYAVGPTASAPTAGLQSVGLATDEANLVYVTDLQSDLLNVYALDPAGGSLTLLPLNCGVARTGSMPIAVATWGKYQ